MWSIYISRRIGLDPYFGTFVLFTVTPRDLGDKYMKYKLKVAQLKHPTGIKNCNNCLPHVSLYTKSSNFSTVVLQGKYTAAQGIWGFHKFFPVEKKFSPALWRFTAKMNFTLSNG